MEGLASNFTSSTLNPHYRFLHETVWLTTIIEIVSKLHAYHPSFGLDEVTARREAKFFLWVRTYAGDYYGLLHQIETSLHSQIRYWLKHFFGKDWWKSGLNEDPPIGPQKIDLRSLLKNVTIANAKWPSGIDNFRSGSRPDQRHRRPEGPHLGVQPMKTRKSGSSNLNVSFWR